MTKNYPAKLLLFGEYTIITGSDALALPLPQFQGHWSKQHPHTPDETTLLNNFVHYLTESPPSAELDFQINTAAMSADFEKGLGFASNIPRGYGLGSSGALVAAVYESYAFNPLQPPFDNLQLQRLKTVLAHLESFFHGASSGIDPLVIYLNTPLLLKAKNEFTQVRFESIDEGKGAIFLINTHLPRQTQPLVNYFVERLKYDKTFETHCKTDVSALVTDAIGGFLGHHTTDLMQSVKAISEFQWTELKPMIPNGWSNFWYESLENPHFSIKLCGAGGGGFLLGFSKNWDETKKNLRHLDVTKVLVLD